MEIKKKQNGHLWNGAKKRNMQAKINDNLTPVNLKLLSLNCHKIIKVQKILVYATNISLRQHI